MTYTYNGALLTKTTWTGEVAGNVGYSYDNDFRVSGVSVNGADAVTYQHDSDGLVTQAGALALERSSQNGFLTGSTLGTVADSISYNGFGEMESYEAKIDGSSEIKIEYTHDKGGRIIAKTETQGSTVNTYEYGYELAGRLHEVKLNGSVTSTYTYDANGNRLSLTRGSTTTTGTYDDQDRLLAYGDATYTYTANGELKSKTVGASTTTYEYDVVGNLRKVVLPSGKVIEYIIDAANRRVGKKVDGVLVQGFLYQDQLQPVAELDGTGAIVSRFIYATRVNVPDYMIKGGIIYRIITDHLGSPRYVINTADGSVVQEMSYDEFGKVTVDNNPGFQPFGFTGGFYDCDTGLVRLGARDYDSKSGRWIIKDPIGFASGNLSLYAYVHADPVNRRDPSGLNDTIEMAEVAADAHGIYELASIARGLAEAKNATAAAALLSAELPPVLLWAGLIHGSLIGLEYAMNLEKPHWPFIGGACSVDLDSIPDSDIAPVPLLPPIYLPDSGTAPVPLGRSRIR